MKFCEFYWLPPLKGRRERHLPGVLQHAGAGVRQRAEGRVRLGQLDGGGAHAQPRLLPVLQRLRHGMADPRRQRGGPHRRGDTGDDDGFCNLSHHRHRRRRTGGGTLSAQQGSMGALPRNRGRFSRYKCNTTTLQLRPHARKNQVCLCQAGTLLELSSEWTIRTKQR